MLKTSLFIMAFYLPLLANGANFQDVWEDVGTPNLVASFKKKESPDYITVAHLDSDSEMSLENQNEKKISEMLTVLRRSALEPMGIKNWTISNLSKSKIVNRVQVQMTGSYTGLSGQTVSFIERMYFAKKKIIQISIIHMNSDFSLKEDENTLRFLEARYL